MTPEELRELAKWLEREEILADAPMPAQRNLPETLRALIEVVRAAQACFDLNSASPEQTVQEFRVERMEALVQALTPFSTTSDERKDVTT